ncbi:MAG: stage II sporulation protein P [Bacillota bacterium]
MDKIWRLRLPKMRSFRLAKVDRKLLVSYLAVFLFFLILLSDLPRFFSEPAVYVIAPSRSGSEHRGFLGMFDLANVSRWCLEQSIPGLRSEDSEGLNFARILSFVTNVASLEPKSLLRVHLPLLEGYLEGTPWSGRVIIPVPREYAEETALLEPRAPVETGNPLVAIYHTHSRETYLPAIGDPKHLKPEDAFSFNPDITVIAVGKELKRALEEEHGIGVVHSTRFHDADGRIGAYVRSLETAQALVKENPTVCVILDIHRDSTLRSESTTTIGGQSVARVMVVLGTDSQLAHPNWRRNYEFALALVRAMERRYPGLSLGVLPQPYRYNQHVLPGALLLEIGGVENTLEECKATARLLAQVLSDMYKRGEFPKRD